MKTERPLSNRAPSRWRVAHPGLLMLLALTPAFAGEPTIESPPLKVVAGQEYEKTATEDLAKIENPADPAALDACIARFPESRAAAVAFATRLSLLRGSPVADDYHRFIETYKDRVGSRLAIGDLFLIYRRADRLSGYLDFMRRYPSSPEAEVAKLHVHQLAFELARHLGTAADYDGFVRLFPDAAQRSAAEAMAEERAVDEERAEYEAQAAKLDGDALADWVSRRLRNYAFESRDIWSAATQEEPTRQVRRFVEEEVLGGDFDPKDAATRAYLAQRVARIYAVVRSIEPYRMNPASDQILAEARHQELVAKLDEIRDQLQKQHEETTRLLSEEFLVTRRTIETGFDALVEQHHLDRELFAKGVQVLAEGMDRLHADLVAVHAQIRGLRVSVDNIDQGIRQANVLLGRLDQQLSAVNDNLYRINVDLNRGFESVSMQIEGMHRDMNANFDRQAAISIQQLQVAEASLDVQTHTLYTIDRGFQQIDLTLQTGFTRMEDATWGAASQIVQSNRQLASRLVSRPRRGVNKELLGTVLGAAATYAGAGPILGPVVGDMAGQLITSAVEGEPLDPVSLGRTAFVAAAETRFRKIPGAGAIAGGVFDVAITERRQNYVRTADALAARTGITRPEQPPWPQLADAAETAEQFRELERRIADAYRLSPDAVAFCATRVY